MALAKILVLVAGLVGVAGFFLPQSARQPWTLYDGLRGIERGRTAVANADVSDVALDRHSDLSTRDVQRDVGILFRIAQAIMLFWLVPSVVMIGLAVRGIVHRAIDWYGWGALPAAALNVALVWPLDDLGLGGFALLASAALASCGGVLALRPTARAAA